MTSNGAVTNSSWAALRNSDFRKLWIATVLSGTCVAAQDNAVTWMMNTLTESPFLISLMSTVASLPFFLFTLPAGALADNVDRKKLVCAINLWLAAIAVALAILARLHLLNPCFILTSVFSSESALPLTRRPGHRSCLKLSQTKNFLPP
jgi:MFS family permease